MGCESGKGPNGGSFSLRQEGSVNSHKTTSAECCNHCYWDARQGLTKSRAGAAVPVRQPGA